MNPRDVALLNGSLDQMSDTLLKQKVLDQQEQDRQATIADRGQQRDLQRKGLEIQQKKLDATTAVAGNKEAERRREVTQRIWDNNTKTFGSLVKDRLMAPDQATIALKHAYDNMPPEAQGFVQDHPTVQALLGGKPIFTAPEPGAGFNTAPIANKKAWEADMAKAKALRDEAAKQAGSELEVDPTAAAQRKVMLDKADEIEKNANEFFKPKPAGAAGASVDVTDSVDANGGKTSSVHRRIDPTAPQPLPSKKEELIKGLKYQTARGLATWDGQKFVK